MIRPSANGAAYYVPQGGWVQDREGALMICPDPFKICVGHGDVSEQGIHDVHQTPVIVESGCDAPVWDLAPGAHVLLKDDQWQSISNGHTDSLYMPPRNRRASIPTCRASSTMARAVMCERDVGRVWAETAACVIRIP